MFYCENQEDDLEHDLENQEHDLENQKHGHERNLDYWKDFECSVVHRTDLKSLVDNVDLIDLIDCSIDPSGR